MKCNYCKEEFDEGVTAIIIPERIRTRAEDTEPVFLCMKCNEYRKEIDTYFTNLCEGVKLYELLKPNSDVQSEYFPEEMFYHVDVNLLRSFYFSIRELALEAFEKSSNKELRLETKRRLIEKWRKRRELDA